MNANRTIAVAILVASFVGGFSIGSATVASAAVDTRFPQVECASGYHAGRHGNCQPDNGPVDSRCPGGFEAAPFTGGNGYHCVPIPEGY